MSLLDRLKREGDQQRALQEVVSRERDSRDLLYKDEIEPRMKALVTYLEALVRTFNDVKPQVVVKMPIAGYGDLGAQPVWDFRVDHDRRYRNFVVTMEWTLRVDPEHTPVVRAEGVTKIKTLTAAFHKFHLGGVKEEKRTKSGELLRMVMSNVSWLGSSQRQFTWQQIDDELSDRIARFIVREDDALFTEELNDALRQQLKKESEAQAIAAELALKLPVEPVAAPTDVPAENLLARPDTPAAIANTPKSHAPVDVAGSAVADILAQLDSNSVLKEDRVRLTEPDAPDLPSLDELNAAFRSMPAKPLVVLPLGVPGAAAEAVIENFVGAAYAERRAPVAAQVTASAVESTPAATSPPAAARDASASLTAAVPVTPASISTVTASAGHGASAPIPAADPAPVPAPESAVAQSAQVAAPSVFMSRMSETLKRLRDDEEDSGD